MCKSVPQIPDESTSITTCRAPAFGSGTSSTSMFPVPRAVLRTTSIREQIAAKRKEFEEFKELQEFKETKPAADQRGNRNGLLPRGVRRVLPLLELLELLELLPLPGYSLRPRNFTIRTSSKY